jgi:uncharacterized protein
VNTPSTERHRAPSPAAAGGLSDAELAELDERLDALPASLEPPDVCALDGFLAGVVLQQPAIPPAQWLPFVTDIDERAVPAGSDVEPIRNFALRRLAQLDAAIGARRWFDPWVFELDEPSSPSEAVQPWVAGFALAMERFPALMQAEAARTLEPLAVLYSHLDADDLEDADELKAEIETLEPAHDLAEAVEDLVRCTLLLADVSRPLPSDKRPRAAGRPQRRAPSPGGPPRRR